MRIHVPVGEVIFSHAFQHSPLLLGISNLDDGRFIDVNERFLDVIGYRREEVIGKSSRDMELFAVPAEWETALARLREGGHIEDYEVHVRNRRGEVRLGLFNAETITLGEGIVPPDHDE